jgi:hypothetical protein
LQSENFAAVTLRETQEGKKMPKTYPVKALRPAAPESSGEFAEQILADLIAQGLQGDALMARFKEMNRAIHPAIARMMEEADEIASGKIASATMDQVFGGED